MTPTIATHELQKLDEMQHRSSRRSAAPIMVGDRFEQQPARSEGKLFTRRPWGEVMEEAAKRPMPKKLFGELWFEGELTILFGETGSGKTALAVQIANDLASGRSSTGQVLETDPQIMAYLDQELSDMQQAIRYTDEQRNGDGQKHLVNVFPFHENLLRIEMDPQQRVFDQVADYEQFVLKEIDREIIESGARAIVIDNITALSREQDKVKFALPLMQRLSGWKKERGLSILVLAHTPKRDESKPLSINDLAGSKILSNLADAVFAIGKSAIDDRVRYLKQIKERSCPKAYGENHVAVFEFEKTDNHLGFKLIGHSKESAHLVTQTDEAREKLIAEIRALNAAGKTQREIADQLQISLGSVNKHLKSAKVSTNGRREIVFEDPGRQAQWEQKCSWEQ